MHGPGSIFGINFSLVVGPWRLGVFTDLDDVRREHAEMEAELRAMREFQALHAVADLPDEAYHPTA